MKKTRKFLYIMASIMLFISCIYSAGLFAQAEPAEGFRDFQYEITDYDTVAISKYTGNAVTLTIPEKIDGKTVTAIGNRAFAKNKALESIILPDTIQTIGQEAFADCTALHSIVPGNQIETIQVSAFENTAIYQNEYSKNNGIVYIGKYLIKYNAGISKKKSLKVKPGTIGIADSACEAVSGGEKRLISLTLPKSLKYIGSNAFSGNKNLKTIKISNKIAKIGHNAFAGTKFYNVKKNWSNGILYLNKYLIKGKTALTSCKIKKGTVLIADEAFGSEHSKLTKITIPKTVKYIGENAFFRSPLKKVSLPKSVQKIYPDAFRECIKISSFHISKANSFYSSKNGLLYNKEQTKLLFYPAASNKPSFDIPSSVKSIGDYAFAFADKLEYIRLSDNTIYIGKLAFLSCTSLKNLKVPKSVEQIGFLGIGATVAYNDDELHWKNAEGFSVLGYKGSAAEKYCLMETYEDTDQYIRPIPFTVCCDENSHRLKTVSEKPATYFSTGHREYQSCEICGEKIGYEGIQQQKLAVPTVSTTTKNRRMTVNYQKVPNASGYQIKYTKDKKSKIKTYNSAKAATRTIKGLKAGKYKVQIRAFITDGKQTAYSNWSKAKTVTIK